MITIHSVAPGGLGYTPPETRQVGRSHGWKTDKAASTVKSKTGKAVDKVKDKFRINKTKG